ncbi:unnamed protein product [Phytomonas sp. Hart1]|nr:unnamed protein product [Phytomonas sp. Hart1]|eukprot:CCW70872.1 unnamed protein product [Phytomonas sp. isolate Hart1]
MRNDLAAHVLFYFQEYTLIGMIFPTPSNCCKLKDIMILAEGFGDPIYWVTSV